VEIKQFSEEIDTHSVVHYHSRMSKNVALTMRMTQDNHGEWRDAIAEDWTQYLHAQDLHEVLVPNDPEHCLSYLDNVSALIISGGDNILLSNLNEESDEPRTLRDRTEYTLLQAAIEKGILIFGVCRGLQLINMYFGGTLASIEEKGRHVATHHTVSIEKGKARTLFPVENMTVNSYHELKIATLGNGLHPFAKSDDSLIEGVHNEEHNLWAVMWHPERPFNNKEATELHANLLDNLLGV